VILPPDRSGFAISFHDLREGAAGLGDHIRADFSRPFDLSAGPLVRASLYRVGESKWVFSYVLHHIISDGWSMEILIREMLALYGGAHGTPGGMAGKDRTLSPLRIQYKDYAVWQQGQLSGGLLSEQRAYWLEQLGGELPVLEMPADRPRPAVKTYHGGVVSRRLDRSLSEGLERLSRGQGGTLFMGLLAVVNTLLYRYTGQEDIIVGSPMAGRDHADLEDQIGFYINTLVLRTRFKGTDSFTDLLDKVREVTVGAYTHQAYPFDELVDELGLRRDISRNALFDVAVTLQSKGLGKRDNALSLGPIKAHGYEGIAREITKFDLSFEFPETAEDFRIEYNSDIYDRQTIERLAGHFERIVQAILRQPSMPIAQLSY
jgi:hypothetical protein